MGLGGASLIEASVALRVVMRSIEGVSPRRRSTRLGYTLGWVLAQTLGAMLAPPRPAVLTKPSQMRRGWRHTHRAELRAELRAEVFTEA
jgi:hypothetical protein